jgi:hypothetical protein
MEIFTCSRLRVNHSYREKSVWLEMNKIISIPILRVEQDEKRIPWIELTFIWDPVLAPSACLYRGFAN